MPTFKRGDVSIHFEEYGGGYPILLFAPGGMRSSIEFWANSPFDPTKELAAEFRVIAMDQRNAGKSAGPISAHDGWDTYTGDHIVLLDHLGIRQCHVMGGCIGSSYCLGVIKAAPQRVSAAILQNPIGLSPRNREMFFRMFDTWADPLKLQRCATPPLISCPHRVRSTYQAAPAPWRTASPPHNNWATRIGQSHRRSTGRG